MRPKSCSQGIFAQLTVRIFGIDLTVFQVSANPKPGSLLYRSGNRSLEIASRRRGGLPAGQQLARHAGPAHPLHGRLDRSGFSGDMAPELPNAATPPIKLLARIEDTQALPLPDQFSAEHPYGSPVCGLRYQDQRGPAPSRLYQNFIGPSLRRNAAGRSKPKDAGYPDLYCLNRYNTIVAPRWNWEPQSQLARISPGRI